MVNPNGSRLWYLKYRINGKESRLALGAYPDVSLAYARQQRDGIRKLLVQKINPAQQRQRLTEKVAWSPEKAFKAIALSWHKSNKTWPGDHDNRVLDRMNKHIFPVIGHLPVTELRVQHFINLLKRIGDYQQGRELTQLAIMLTLHVFIRSSELRFARWPEINFRKALDYPRHSRNYPQYPLLRARGKNAYAAYCAAVPTGHRHSGTDKRNLRLSGRADSTIVDISCLHDGSEVSGLSVEIQRVLFFTLAQQYLEV